MVLVVLLRFYSKVIQYISIKMCYLYGQFLTGKFIKLMQDLTFRTPGMKNDAVKHLPWNIVLS